MCDSDDSSCEMTCSSRDSDDSSESRMRRVDVVIRIGLVGIRLVEVVIQMSHLNHNKTSPLNHNYTTC